MKDRAEFKNRFHKGGYSLLLSVIAVAVVVFVNLLIGQLPSNLTKLDSSSTQLFTISQQTEEIAGGVTEPITLYLIAQQGSEDQSILELLNRYAALNGNIKVETVDPVIYPTFTQKYTSDTIDVNSVIVVGEKRSKVVAYSDIYVTSYGYDSSYNYTTSTSFDGEGQITSAIDYVTSDNLPKIYTLTGHGESTMGDTLSQSVAKENMELVELNLLTDETVPEDANCLFIFSPTSDISSEEAGKITDYLGAGGRLMLVTDYTETDMPNLLGVMEDYGVTLTKGLVFEGDTTHCLSGYAHYLLPDIDSHEITDPIISGGLNILAPMAQGIAETDVHRSTITISPLLTTSSSSYSKVDLTNAASTDKEEGDIDGPFNLAVAISEEYEDIDTRLVWFTTSALLDEEVNSYVSGSNYDFVLNSFGWMCEHEQSITIHSKDLSTQYLTVSAAQSNIFSIIIAVVLPLAVVIAGFVVWLRRRRR